MWSNAGWGGDQGWYLNKSAGGGGGWLNPLDGAAHANSSGATTTAVLTTTKINNIIVAFITTNGGGVSDGCTLNGTAMTLRATAGVGSSIMEMYWILSAGILTAANVVYTPTSANFTTVDVFAINGAHTAAPFDVNGVLPVIGSADPLSISTTAANTIIIGGFRNTTGTTSPGAGYTAIGTGGVGTTDFQLIEYQIVSSAQSGLSVTMGTGAGSSNHCIADAIVQGP
jgi:hypothetical protein